LTATARREAIHPVIRYHALRTSKVMGKEKLQKKKSDDMIFHDSLVSQIDRNE